MNHLIKIRTKSKKYIYKPNRDISDRYYEGDHFIVNSRIPSEK